MSTPTRKQKLLRKVYGALSLSTAMFVFQACYGPPKDMGADILIEGTVKSKTTNLPVAGIKVFVEGQHPYEVTDSTGKFKIYVAHSTEYLVHFWDEDQTKSGSFQPVDTTIKITNDYASLNVVLNEEPTFH